MSSELAPLQVELARAIRTPLQVGHAELVPHLDAGGEAALARVAEGTLGAASHLAIYQMQHWQRLLAALQVELPLTARLLGLFTFNLIAMRFLELHPPAREIERIADGFDAYVRRALPPETSADDRAAVTEAAALDLAWSRAASAWPDRPWSPTPDELASMGTARLAHVSGFGVVPEAHELVALRERLRGDRGESRVARPPRRAEPQWWALFPTAEGVGRAHLEPDEARLHLALATLPLDEALAHVEDACAEHARATLPARVGPWLQRAMKLGWLAGLATTPGA